MDYPLQEDIKQFNLHFKSLIESDFSLINLISSTIFQAKGKQFRPQLVFASYKLFQNQLNSQAYLSASLIEIIHTASLIHDDVVDESDQRRGFPTINFEKGNKTAVLVGDYLLSNAFLKAFSQQNAQLLYILVQVIKEMSEGELLQLQYQNFTLPTFEVCEQISKLKTASLFSCCCRCGAYTAGASEKEIEILGKIGEHLGLAFQLEDDLLDMNAEISSGKPIAQDLSEGKITYPVLVYISSLSQDQRNEFVSKISDAEMDYELLVKQIYTPTIEQNVRIEINNHIKTALNLLQNITDLRGGDYFKNLIFQIFPKYNES